MIAAHGLVVDRPAPGRSSLINRDELSTVDADYIALGHVHVHQWSRNGRSRSTPVRSPVRATADRGACSSTTNQAARRVQRGRLSRSSGGSFNEVSNRRWSEDTPTDISDARERLLDSAEACFSRFGLNETTVDDIAAHAKVSRATVYRYFDGRDALILGVLQRELGRFSVEMTDRLHRFTDLSTFIVESIMLTIEGVRTNPHLAILFAPQAAGITGEVAGASESLFKMSSVFLHPYLERA